MNAKYLLAPALLAAVGLATLLGSLAVADSSSDAPSGSLMKIPDGWTAEDMQAMMTAATPGKMHEFLTNDIGTWRCKTTMWTAADSEPMTSEGTSEVTSLLDGRYTKCEMNGEMPGMGPYNGFAIYGYDNVSKKFVSIWIDNFSTSIMNGVGELSSDGKTLNWEYTGNCPIAKKPVTVREVETITGPDTKTIEMFGTGPKGDKEFKMMRLELTKE